MPKSKVRRRRKFCPICKEIIPMSVIREAEDKSDLWWLLCSSCNSRFALTSREYYREKKPDINALERDNATIYSTEQTYSIGELIYHPQLEDMGLVLDKSDPPLEDCSGSIIVSFVKGGQKTLIEGYDAV